MIPEAQSALATFAFAESQLLTVFARIPDDRLLWRPSETARTPIAQVVHCGDSLHHITEMLKGRRFAPPTTPEADAQFWAYESEFVTRESALEVFRAGAAEYREFLESLSSDDLDRIIPLPFSFGEMPLRNALSAGSDHTRWHQAQLEYMESIWGDRAYGF